MRRFTVSKSNGYVQADRHLEFGDFRRVEEAVSCHPSGHYIVRLDDHTGAAEVSEIEDSAQPSIHEHARKLLDRYPTRPGYALAVARKRAKDATARAIEEKWTKVAELIELHRKEN